MRLHLLCWHFHGVNSAAAPCWPYYVCGRKAFPALPQRRSLAHTAPCGLATSSRELLNWLRYTTLGQRGNSFNPIKKNKVVWSTLCKPFFHVRLERRAQHNGTRVPDTLGRRGWKTPLSLSTPKIFTQSYPWELWASLCQLICKVGEGHWYPPAIDNFKLGKLWWRYSFH